MTEEQTTAAATETQTPASTADAPATPPEEQTAPKDLLDSGSSDQASSEPAGDVLSGDDNPAPEGVPDEYAFEPQEGGITPDEATLEAYKGIAKEAGLSQSQFQKLAQYSVERSQAATQEAVDAWNTRVDGWKQSARNDQEFGGQNFEANVAQSLKLVEKFGDAEFKALLKSPDENNPEGLAIGNHPAVLRFLNRIAKQVISEPDLVQGDASNRPTTDEEKLRRLYPSMFKATA